MSLQLFLHSDNPETNILYQHTLPDPAILLNNVQQENITPEKTEQIPPFSRIEVEGARLSVDTNLNTENILYKVYVRTFWRLYLWVVKNIAW